MLSLDVGGNVKCQREKQKFVSTANQKFSRYYFSEHEGTMVDAKHGYQIEFAADFKHFFLSMYDERCETLTLEYYDNKLKKIWKKTGIKSILLQQKL